MEATDGFNDGSTTTNMEGVNTKEIEVVFTDSELIINR